MLRTGDDYRASLRDGREVWIEGEKVPDVPRHPAFQPIVDRLRGQWSSIRHYVCFDDLGPDGFRALLDEQLPLPLPIRLMGLTLSGLEGDKAERPRDEAQLSLL